MQIKKFKVVKYKNSCLRIEVYSFKASNYIQETAHKYNFLKTYTKFSTVENDWAFVGGLLLYLSTWSKLQFDQIVL